MYTFLVILFVLLSFLMVVVILLQAGKGQGLSGSIGGGMAGQTMFGARGAADFLSKTTTYIAAGYMILAIIMGVMYKSESEEAQQSLIEQRVQEEQQSLPESTLPVAPIEESAPLETPVGEEQSQEGENN